MGKYGIAFAAFPFTPFDQESLHFLPVLPGNNFNNTGAVAPELIDLPPDIQVIFSWKIRKIAGAVDILEMVPVGEEVYPRADLLHPAGSLRVNQVDRYVIAHI